MTSSAIRDRIYAVEEYEDGAGLISFGTNGSSVEAHDASFDGVDGIVVGQWLYAMAGIGEGAPVLQRFNLSVGERGDDLPVPEATNTWLSLADAGGTRVAMQAEDGVLIYAQSTESTVYQSGGPGFVFSVAWRGFAYAGDWGTSPSRMRLIAPGQ